MKMAVIPLLFLVLAAAVRGQSALDGFDPNANDFIRVIVVQPDGKILIGGAFTTLSPNGGPPVTRNHIARLNPDGTLDTLFNPNASDYVLSIALQTDGKVLVGGLFASIGGQTRNRIARLDATTGLADSFDPNANDYVSTIAVQADGKILAGGLFASIGGQTRKSIARLDPTTGLADSFDPNGNGFLDSIVVQADGKILAGGSFTAIGGQARTHLARLDATTGQADSFDPHANGYVATIAVQADGKIVAGGQFFSIGGQMRNYIARLDPTTGLADSFNPNAGFVVNSIALQADGKILAGGYFHFIGGQARDRIARLDPTTGLADSFNPTLSDIVQSVAVQADGKILAGGDFTAAAPNGETPVTRNHLARLETGGRLDRTLDLGMVGNYVFATALQADGKILIGGGFSTVLGVARNNIARLNQDGTLDTSFDPNASSIVRSIVVQVDGKILVGGSFIGANSIGGQTRNRIARLDPTTGLADSFDPNAGNDVNALAVQLDGKVLAGGFFTIIGGQPRNYIARLDSVTGAADPFNPNANQFIAAILVQGDGKILAGGGFFGANSIGGQTRNYFARLDPATGLADSFDPNANNSVITMAVQGDGKILAGGNFSGANSIGGQARNHVARLDATTGLADSFNPSANGFVTTIAVQSDGKILAGGGFSGTSSIGGQTRNFIARLNGTTGSADSFDPNASSTVSAVALQADGKILAGGDFTGANSIGGQSRTGFARLSNDTAARQDLAVAQSAIVWTRSGSSPQLMRATFESSTDNVNYTPLGNGTAAGSNWTLAGFNLPTGVNLYIRARGYYCAGNLTASQSITESVRLVFLVPPAITSANNTAFTVGTAGTFTVTTSGMPTGASMSITESGALPGGVTFVNNGNGTATLAGTPNAGAGGIYPITITANNGVSPNASQNFTLNVNQPPAITSANNTTFTIGTAGTFGVTTTGFPTGAGMLITESGALPSGVTFVDNNNGTATFAGTPNGGTGGIYPITITANNGVSPNASQNFTLTVNQPPAITSANNTTFTVSIPGTFSVTTTGFPTGAIMAITESGALPAGVTFTNNNNGTATLAGSPGAGAAGTYPFIITADNGVTPNATQAFTLTVIAPTAATFGNISTRLRVETGDNVLIGGFIITGTQPKKIIVRAIGPSLSSFFPGVLGDPVLELRDSSGALLATNDNWRSDQQAEILATGIPPADDLESAIVATLPANNAAYTAIVRGVNNATGIGVVEAYDLDHTVDSKLGNISTRGLVQTGDNVMIGGLIVLGQNPLRVIVRAIGPSLPVPGALGDPILELHDGNGALIAANDSWRSDQEAEIIATGIPPSSDLEAAIVRSFAPGNYTAIVRGVNNTTGVAVVEAYGLN
jgi:uncharacterized delta-60 repeat protein